MTAGEAWPVGDVRITAYVEGPGPVLVVWPALGVPARFYRPLVPHLRGHGFSVVLADYPGQGENRPRVGHGDRTGYHRLASAHLPAVLAEIAKRCPGQPIVLLGHSLGGQVGVSYAARHPGDLAGIALVAAGTPYFRAFPAAHAVRFLLSIQTVRLVAEAVGYWPGDRLRFGGRQSRALVRDWARFNRTGRMAFAGSTPYDEDVARLELPVLAISVEGDSYAPSSAVDDLCRRMQAADLTRWHHDAAGLDHFRWVKQAGPIADRIAEWWQLIRTDRSTATR